MLGLLRTVQGLVFGRAVVRHVSPLFSNRFALVRGVLQTVLYLLLGVWAEFEFLTGAHQLVEGRSLYGYVRCGLCVSTKLGVCILLHFTYLSAIITYFLYIDGLGSLVEHNDIRFLQLNQFLSRDRI